MFPPVVGDRNRILVHFPVSVHTVIIFFCIKRISTGLEFQGTICGSENNITRIQRSIDDVPSRTVKASLSTTRKKGRTGKSPTRVKKSMIPSTKTTSRFAVRSGGEFFT